MTYDESFALSPFAWRDAWEPVLEAIEEAMDVPGLKPEDRAALSALHDEAAAHTSRRAISLDELRRVRWRKAEYADDAAWVATADATDGLTEQERAELAERAALEADYITQFCSGSTDPDSFGWVADLNGMVDLMDDLRTGQPLRRDEPTRTALCRILDSGVQGLEEYMTRHTTFREDIAAADIAGYRASIDLTRRALAMVGGDS
jgi:hypothetical protein